MENEQWHPVSMCPAKYYVSSSGRVRRETPSAWDARRGNRFLRGSVDSNGYISVALYFGVKRKVRGVHQLVADAFLGTRPDGKEVNHIDSNKHNNRVENLEYVTKDENLRHAIRAGVRWVPSGENCKQTKLTLDQVRQIKEVSPGAKIPYGLAKKMAIEFGVSRSAITAVHNGTNW